MTWAIFSRVSRYAPAEASRNATLATSRTGKVRKVISARPGSSTTRITAVPTSVSVAENSVEMPSVTSWSSAWMSFVRREISTPARLRE